jgi:hypothetical protein
LLGFWHGIIAPVTLIGEIVNKVAPTLSPWVFKLYEAQGTGVLYDVGFFVGLLAWLDRRARPFDYPPRFRSCWILIGVGAPDRR